MQLHLCHCYCHNAQLQLVHVDALAGLSLTICRKPLESPAGEEHGTKASMLLCRSVCTGEHMPCCIERRMGYITTNDKRRENAVVEHLLVPFMRYR